MPSRSLVRITAFLLALVPGMSLRAQQLIGYVSTKDATIKGATDVMDGHAVLAGSVTVTAKDHTVPITLSRGGDVQLCQSTTLRISESRVSEAAAPLLFSIDRGAIELQMTANPRDAVMTPDLRFFVHASGPVDLHLRVASNGDTCAENRGARAPTLTVSDPFGAATYELRAEQHVLFEHGSVREVVDHETLPCGCPAPGTFDPLLSNASPAAKAAAQKHPFPSAISEGLAPEAGVPPANPGDTHVQVSDNLHYDAAPDGMAVAPVATAPSPPAKPHGFFHAIGHFFRRLFGGT